MNRAWLCGSSASVRLLDGIALSALPRACPSVPPHQWGGEILRDGNTVSVSPLGPPWLLAQGLLGEGPWAAPWARAGLQVSVVRFTDESPEPLQGANRPVPVVLTSSGGCGDV